jgi:hypothetical protein
MARADLDLRSASVVVGPAPPCVVVVVAVSGLVVVVVAPVGFVVFLGITIGLAHAISPLKRHVEIK